MKAEDVLIQAHRSEVSTFELAAPGGSWGTPRTVSQLVLAARELKQKILRYAVQPLPQTRTRRLITPPQPAFFPDKRPEDLDIKEGVIYEIANQVNSKTFDPAIVHPSISMVVPGLTSDEKPDPTLYVMSRQAHFIEVEVDTETGHVDVTKIVCVNDVGNIFNPEGAEGQQYGGAVMGLSRSLIEEKVFCPRSGVALNNNHIGYPIATMNDYPEAQCILNESHLGYSAYGAYGIGENVGAAMSGLSSAAIYNATGKWVLDFPTAPEKVLKALGKISE
jgi:CO/xanthine dehydrogenase Mo-binding subunit